MNISARLIHRFILAVSVMTLLVLPRNTWAFNSADYFPLTTGIVWTYTGPTTVTVSSAQYISGTVTLQSSNGGRSYNTNTSGIRLHGQYTQNVSGSTDLTITFTPPIVLANASANFGDTVGPQTGTAQFAFTCNPGTANLPYTATFTVTDPGDVTVPAGTFTDVVQLSGTIHIDAGQFSCPFGPYDIPEQNLSVTSYVARNIGGVKLISDTDTSELTAANILLPAVTPSTGTYGSVGYPGGTSDKIFTIQNTGPATLNISSALVGDADFSFQVGGGAVTLGPNSGTDVTVRFAPNSTGAKSGTLEISSTDYPGATPKDVALSGTGASHDLTITGGPSGSPDPVASGGTVAVSVTASDSFGHTLTYAWTVTSCTGGLTSGSFNNAALQNPTWTAPANATGSQQSCTIQVTVNDGILSPVVGSYSQEVNAIPPHALSIIGGPSGSPNPVASGGTATLGVTAEDTFGHSLSYAWAVTGCTGGLGTGSFNNASAQNPTWTAPTNTTGSAQSCTIQVTVNDGAGGGDPKSVSQSFTETVNILTHTVAITGGPSGNPNPVASGGTVALSVTANDTFGHSLSYAWAVTGCTGGLGTGSFNNASAQNPTWTAPTNTTGSAQSCTIQVTVNDGVLPAVLNSYIQTVGPAAAPPPSYTLTVNKLGTGSGGVASSPGGIDCGGDCSESYVSGTSVTLTATPSGGASFGGWGGDCLHAGPAVTCNLTMGGARTVSATFNPPPPPGSYTLTVTKAGTGMVTSSPSGIDCGGTCSAPFTTGAGVTLTAAPTDGATFGGWGGDCAGFGTALTCTLTMTAAKTASATFNAPPPPDSYTLTITKGGTGSGTVTSSPGGIDCGGDCNESYTSGTSVTLTAAATDGSTFDGWGGDCVGFGTGTTCNLTMDGAKAASATFTAPPAPASPLGRTFLTTDSITVEHIYYDPNDACLGVSPFTLKFFVFNLEGQLILGRNRDTTGGVTNTRIGTSKSWTLLATLDPGTLPPGTYNVVFRVEDCTATSVYVSEFYTIEVFAAP